LLVSLVLALVFCSDRKPLSVARAVALGVVAMGIGGTMTYGQTVGLTHNPEFIGNWAALRWGMLGLAIKGGIWIGFCGLFLGMGLGGVRYRWREMFGLMAALLGAFFIGQTLLNSPFDPANRVLPPIYFSASWYWQPDAEALKPRPEYWGGLLLALVTALAYAGWWRKDGLALRLGLWGFVGGMIGFPGGQSFQAYHAWNREAFQQGLWAWLDPHMNWWNMMETTFGTLMGATLGLGLWLNRARINPADAAETELPASGEAGLLAVHLSLLAAVEFLAVPAVDSVYDLGLIMAIIPIVGIAGGRWWPYLAIFPVTLLPIAGKTLDQLAYREGALSVGAGWAIYFVLPMLVASAAAVYFARRSGDGRAGARPHRGGDSGNFLRASLLLSTWMYFLLNYAFFHFPWPWAQWTGRTPNGIIFTVCAAGLTVLAISKCPGKAKVME